MMDGQQADAIKRTEKLGARPHRESVAVVAHTGSDGKVIPNLYG
jgi:hypothetical protein